VAIRYKSNIILTLDDINVEGRKVLLRVDINSPIDPASQSILDDTRFRAHAPTIRELVEKGAAVVVMSHQGRPAGDDFVRLEKHAEVLSRVTGLPVDYVEDVIGPEARRRIGGLKPGQVLLLDNTRLVSEDYVEAPPETHARSIMVRTLSRHANIYVNDAFATVHRSQASIVGFPLVIPAAAGRLLEREVRALSRAVSSEEKPKVFVLGGAKLKDTVRVIRHLVESGAADDILTVGLVGLLFLLVQGVRVGAAEKIIMKKAGQETIDLARELVARGAPIRVPRDFLAEINGDVEIVDARNIRGAPKDVGPETVEYYGQLMENARVIVMRGPACVIEDPRFRSGTRLLVQKALETGAFTIFGGGHFNAILSTLPETLRQRVGHISTGGGALLYFLAGRELPGLKALASSPYKS